ncbi:translocation protein TolB [Neobacillus pocheonensis]|uniref:translocation protein TolB n=1 Tax=Neobacillus pocheonensis TaxID=363869 RepID=UPI003D2E94A8
MLNAESSSPYAQIGSHIENFSWLPDGKGFITSSKESEKLNSDIILSRVLLGRKNLEIKHFYTVPVHEDELFVSTSRFKWSHDNKWIAFLMVPTASLSADGNKLCVLSSNGKVFKRVDEMLNYEEWFQWAPTRDVLGYISGVGREAMKNKQMKTISFPAFVVKDITPRGSVDRDLAWKNNGVLFVSRSKESELVDISDRPLPSIFEISKKQRQVTFPSKNEGDFAPQYLGNTLYWIRTDRKTANILVSRPNESKEKQWIKDITLGTWYYEKWHWDEVFDLYNGTEGR